MERPLCAATNQLGHSKVCAICGVKSRQMEADAQRACQRQEREVDANGHGAFRAAVQQRSHHASRASDQRLKQNSLQR